MKDYERVFEPISVGDLRLKNRIMMAPMEVGMGGEGGLVNERLIKFLSERAKHDVSIIVSGSISVSPEGRGQVTQLSCYDDEFIPGLRALASAVHKVGSKMGAQIYHAGRQAAAEVTGFQPIAPSAIPCPFLKNHPREMKERDFEKLLDKFTEGAKRLEKAGMDLIEVHLAHGYLLHSFLSPFSNNRKDEYGGRLENRLRFPRQVIKAIMSCVSVPVTIRISAEEFIDDGLHIDEVDEICQLLEEDGIMAVSLSAGSYGSMPMVIQPMMIKRGFLVPYAERIKKHLRVPVIVAGRLNQPELIRDIIASDKADMVALGRELIADEQFVTKMKEGKPERITRCVACNQGCIDNVAMGRHVTCTVNPKAGFEIDMEEERPEAIKKVMVIGGGPAGLSAAKKCAERSHRVIIVEKQDQLGGKIILASSTPGKEELGLITEDLIRSVAALENVSVRRGTAATRDLIISEAPDVLIIAVGAVPVKPAVEGVELGKVVFAEEILQDEKLIKKRVIIVGGGLVGVDTALELRNRGAGVLIVEMLSEIAKDAGHIIRSVLLEEIEAKGIRVLTNCRVEKILEEGVIVRKSGSEKELQAECVVLAVGYRSNEGTVERLKGIAREEYVVGDALEPRSILHAIRDGYRTGLIV